VAVICRRELGSYFHGPVAYSVGVLVSGVAAALFFSVFFLYGRAELRRFFELLPILYGVAIPVLALRQVGAERQNGMYEVLTTLPTRPSDVLLGKYLALWTTAVVILLPTLVFGVIVLFLGPLDVGAAVAGYIGAVLLAGALSGVALMAATFTRSIAVSFGIGLILCVMLASFEAFAPILPPALGRIVSQLSTAYHMADFGRGVIDLRSIIYFASVALISLALARHTIRVRR
jgi:ABC-2 type transport system permease protein